jgi:hypothetical protein
VGRNEGHFIEPSKDCVFAPYLMFIIEAVINRSFPKEGVHMPFKPNPTKKPLIPSAQASSPLRAGPTPQQQHGAEEPVRLIEVTRASLPPDSVKNPPHLSRRCPDFYLACVTLTMPRKQGFMRREKPRRSYKRTWKKWRKPFIPTRLLPLQVLRKEREQPSSPFEQRYVIYDNFDPSHPFAPYASSSQMEFDS